MKKKMMIIIICTFVIGLIIIKDVTIKKIQEKMDNNTSEMDNHVGVTRGQTAKMLSDLSYSKEECEKNDRIIEYKDTSSDMWYDKYINSIYIMGLLENNQNEFRPLDYLTFGECQDFISNFIMFYNKTREDSEKIKDQDIIFPINNKQDNDIVSIKEWGDLYENLANKSIDKQENKFEVKKIFVIDIKIKESSNVIWDITSEDNVYNYEGLNPEGYMDQNIKVLLKGNEIIFVKGVVEDAKVLGNVWIISNKDNNIVAYINGVNKTFITNSIIEEDVKQVVADLVIKDRKVSKISIKPEIVNSKVLLANNEYVEFLDYGKLYLEDDYKIYKIYGELSMESTNGILVGYNNTDFVVSNGKICAALIKGDIRAKNIRVLLKTNNFSDLYHKSIILTSNKDFIIYYGKKEKKFQAGKVITIEKDSKYLADGRLRIETKEDDGRINILSIKRSYGNPSYRGSMEIALNESGLTLINELSLEEYLYAVIPSEMPTSYGLEALKVQAICARSYAYNQLLTNKYSSLGAHVDDSVSFQVYNNLPEDKESVLAIKDTYGKVLEYKGEIISAYYFSTSCGYTSSAYDVWGTDKELEYLSGKLQIDDSESVMVSSNEVEQGASKTNMKLDLSKEKAFREFVTKSDYKTYDREFAWYRWKVEINIKNLKAAIDKSLRSRYNANPNLIQTLVEEDGKREYVSYPIDTVGEIVRISISNRGISGIVNEIIIEGTKNTIKVATEYNIRTLLAPIYNTVIRQDKSEVSELSMLPSAFFIIDEKRVDKKLETISLIGGGYGHGVGMSQNGVKAMVELGKKYDEILKHYYTGIVISDMYQTKE